MKNIFLHLLHGIFIYMVYFTFQLPPPFFSRWLDWGYAVHSKFKENISYAYNINEGRFEKEKLIKISSRTVDEDK